MRGDEIYDNDNVEDVEDLNIDFDDEDDDGTNIMTTNEKKNEELKQENPCHGILHIPREEPVEEKPRKSICWQETVLTDTGNEIPLSPPSHIRPRYIRLLSLAYKYLSDCCVKYCNLSCNGEEDFMPSLEDSPSEEEILRRKKELYAMMFQKCVISESSSMESLDENESMIGGNVNPPV